MASNPQSSNSYRYIGGDVPENLLETLVHVIVDAKVTILDERAFDKCRALKSISLPNGLKEISKLAFHMCDSLESIHLPDGLERIGKWAFKNCYSLLSINIPSGVKHIGMWAFSDCDSLTSVHLPDGLERINSDAFMGCDNLSYVHLPNELKEIGKDAFKGCTSLSSIHLPDGLERVGEGAFMDCISLTSIHLPNRVKRIGEKAFEGCTSLSSIHLSDGLENISHGGFKNCTLLSSIYLPDGLNAIGAEAFYGCISLSSIHLPDGLEKIGNRAFDGCTRLLIIAISRETTIGEGAFRKCKALKAKIDATEPFRVDQLKTRFNDLPLHLACYKGNETEIKELLTKETALQTDDYNVTPLHILASNCNATKRMIRLVADQYQNALTSTAGAFQMSPLHFASINPGDHVIQFLPYLTKGRTRTPGQGKLGCTLQNTDCRTPTILSILYNSNLNVKQHLFKCQPCDASPFHKEIDKDQVIKLEQWYVNHITSLKPGDFNSFDEKHGWVQFISTVVERDSIENICEFILNSSKCPNALVKVLANATDDENRKAIDVAVQQIESAFLQRLLFFGRYEINSGPYIYKSDTCIVVEAFDMKGDEYYKKIFEDNSKGNPTLSKTSFRELLISQNISEACDDEAFERAFAAYDQDSDEEMSCAEFVSFCIDALNQGKYRKVAIKFMKVEEQFHNEIQYRQENEELVKKQAVIAIDEHHNTIEDSVFKSAMESFQLDRSRTEKLIDYKYAIVMPRANRNLDTISRSERPDLTKIRSDAHDIAQKLKILHDNNIIHGDLKMQNIVRQGEKLVLIDLDASATKSTSIESKDASCHVGKKFSSGILPPEMIYHFKKNNEVDKFTDYFEHLCKKSIGWKKIEPKKLSLTREFFVVKTFETKLKTKEGILGINEGIEEIKNGLPYDPVKATAAIDLWSFGTMLYFLCSKRSLFEVNVDGDLVDGDAMAKLYNWSDDRKNQVINASPIEDPLVKKLLCRLLSKQPLARGTMDDLLNDPFFDELLNEQMSIKINAGCNEIEDGTTSEIAEEKEESLDQQPIIRNHSGEDEEGEVHKKEAHESTFIDDCSREKPLLLDHDDEEEIVFYDHINAGGDGDGDDDASEIYKQEKALEVKLESGNKKLREIEKAFKLKLEEEKKKLSQQEKEFKLKFKAAKKEMNEQKAMFKLKLEDQKKELEGGKHSEDDSAGGKKGRRVRSFFRRWFQ